MQFDNSRLLLHFLIRRIFRATSAQCFILNAFEIPPYSPVSPVTIACLMGFIIWELGFEAIQFYGAISFGEYRETKFLN